MYTKDKGLKGILSWAKLPYVVVVFSDITSRARPLARLGTSKKVIEVCSWYAGPYLNTLGKTELDVLRFLKRVLDLTTLARTSFWQFVVEGYERVISLGPTW